MNSTKKVYVTIDSLKYWKLEERKKMNLIKSICDYFDYTYYEYEIDDDDDDEVGKTVINIQCCYDDVEKLINIFKDFDIYIDDVNEWIYQYSNLAS